MRNPDANSVNVDFVFLFTLFMPDFTFLFLNVDFKFGPEFLEVVATFLVNIHNFFQKFLKHL